MENQAADCLSQLFPIHDPEIERKYNEPDLLTIWLDKIDSVKESLDAAITDQEGSDIDTEQLSSSSTEGSTKKRYMGADELLSEDEQDTTTDADLIETLLQQYQEWCKDKIITLLKEKPNAGGKLWRKIGKERMGT